MTTIKNSRNFVAGSVIAPNGTVHIGDTIITNLYSFAEFRALQSRFEKAEQEFKEVSGELALNPKSDFLIRLVLKRDKERAEIKDEIEVFKSEIIKLADEFSRINIDTGRLKQAKQYFTEGNVSALRAVLDPEVMKKELNDLLQESENLESKVKQNKNNLTSKSEEFLLLALITAANFDVSDRFEQTVAYFELSLKAIKTINNLHDYSLFLHKHNEVEKAVLLMEEALQLYTDVPFKEENKESYYESLELVLNNISALYKDNSNLVKSKEAAQKALSICLELVQINPQKFQLKEVAAKVNLANIYSIESRVDEGLKLLFEALNLLETKEKMATEELAKYAIVLHNIAVNYNQKHDAILSIQYYERAINIYQSLVESEPASYLHLQVHVMKNEAFALYTHNQLEESIQLYKKVVPIYRVLAKDNPAAFMGELATALIGIADAYDANKNTEEAFKSYEEADSIFRHIAEDNKYYLPEFARNLNSWGTLHQEKGDKSKASKLFEDSLKEFKYLSIANPKLYRLDIAKVLNNLGLTYKGKQEYAEAEMKFKESLKIRRELAVGNEELFLPDVALVLSNLANLLPLMAKNSDAEQCYLEALAIRRQLSAQYPEKFLPKVAHSAMNIAVFYTTIIPNKEKAIQYATEAVNAAYPFYQSLPMAAQYIQGSLDVIAHWGEDPAAVWG